MSNFFKIEVPCQDGTDPNCHGEVEVEVTQEERDAYEEEGITPPGSICAPCGSDQVTCRDDD
jgi:hypothetical protein